MTFDLPTLLALLRSLAAAETALKEQKDRLELAIMEARGQGEHPAARWLRARIAGDFILTESIAAEHRATYWQSPANAAGFEPEEDTHAP